VTARTPDPPECDREKWCDMPGGHSGECRSADVPMTARTPDPWAELRRLAEAATPGPWHAHGDCCSVVFASPKDHSCSIAETFAGRAARFADRDLIVAAVNGVSGLLAERDQLLGALSEIERLTKPVSMDMSGRPNHAPIQSAGVGRIWNKVRDALDTGEARGEAAKPKSARSRLALDALRDLAEQNGVTYWDGTWKRQDFIDALTFKGIDVSGREAGDTGEAGDRESVKLHVDADESYDRPSEEVPLRDLRYHNTLCWTGYYLAQTHRKRSKERRGIHPVSRGQCPCWCHGAGEVPHAD
jgi:hypothetical protein